MSQDSRDIDLDGDVEDSEDPDIFEGGDEPIPEPNPELEPESMMSPEEQQEEIPTMESNEFKTVPGVQSPDMGEEPIPESGLEQEHQQEDDVLFGDAPDYRTKKVGYN
jgi:hypothetical protein